MRIQVPRVQVTSKKMRRAVIVQSIVSFIFNLSILVLAILIVAPDLRFALRLLIIGIAITYFLAAIFWYWR
jgi:hypothetical protein